MIASLVGVAPLNPDSGQMCGQRTAMMPSASLRTRGSVVSARLPVEMATQWRGIMAYMYGT
jgi:hypothetical protein